MNKSIMIAGSYPTVITSGGNPRVNKEAVDNDFLKKYISMLGELLKVKGELKNIKITYIGGYSKEDNISRSKLYISAFNYYLNFLGFDSLSKENLSILDPDNIDEIILNLEQCDLMFLGIGSDQVFGSTLGELEKRGIYLNNLIEEKNMLVSSICSGSVMSAERIYGGVYDTYYYQKEAYRYPLNISSLSFNPVTMETDFCPNDATNEKNLEFIDSYLKPDSEKCLFFACCPNSFFLIGEDEIYSYGEVYLFADGEYYPIQNGMEKSDVSKLVSMVQKYNSVKNGNRVFDDVLLETIRNEIGSLYKSSIINDLDFTEKQIIEEFVQREDVKKKTNQTENNRWKNDLKSRLDYLFSEDNLSDFSNNYELKARFAALDPNIVDSYNINNTEAFIEELYLKMNLVSLIKVSYINYPGYYSDFKSTLYSLLGDYLLENQLLTYYALESCGSLFTNTEVKGLLKSIELDCLRRPQAIIDGSKDRQKLFRKEFKYERS